MVKRRSILHIKRHTKGAYNELSFDVLDAERDKLDTKASNSAKSDSYLLDFRRKPGDGKGNAAPSASQQTSVSVPHATTRSAASTGNKSRNKAERKAGRNQVPPSSPAVQRAANAEVERRKQHRKVRTLRNVIITAVVVVVIAVVGGNALYNTYKESQDFEYQFSHLVDLVSASDEEMVRLDKFMDDPLVVESSEETNRMRKQIVSVSANIDQASSLASSLMNKAPSQEDETALKQVLAGVQGRQDMVDQALDLLDIVDEVLVQQAVLEAIWSQVIGADIAAREAIVQANESTTQQALSASSMSLKDAQGTFVQAAQQLRDLQSVSNAIDLADQIVFVEKRIEALGYALSVNYSLSKQNKKAAQQQNEQYTQADKESAAMAEELPPSATQLVEDGYQPLIVHVQEVYSEARGKVTEADALVRSYLGERQK